MNNEKIPTSTNINWYPGHMAKTRRLIAEKYPYIDIVYELVDPSFIVNEIKKVCFPL